MPIKNHRRITKQTEGTATVDGAGVRLNRIIGNNQLNILDPFLLLDEFNTENPDDYSVGFPDHPHRGFETVTYMLAGRIRHKDNAGHEGVIEAGGVQWMTAGCGIIHSEMPEQQDGLMWGFQLWINLPAAEKMSKPRYQEFSQQQIPLEKRENGVNIQVIAGTTASGVTGPSYNATTQPVYFDITLPPFTEFIEPLPEEHNAFIYVYNGDINVISDGSEPHTADKGILSIIEHGDGLRLTSGNAGAKLLLIAAKPLHEPVVRSGPFVMNTRAQINQAIEDYKLGRF
jgi:quercetin 2,3-dioxygenase